MNAKINLIFHIITVGLYSCGNVTSEEDALKGIEDVHCDLVESQVDSLKLFFGSEGVIRFKPTDDNLRRDLEILNDNNTVYATINISLNRILIEGNSYALDYFSNDSLIREKYHFFPKEFYPDQSIIQFEYDDLTNDFATIFINKHQKKKLRLSNATYSVEPWRQHLLGCMIDFNEKRNPIRGKMIENAKSLGYENSDKDYIFVISEIVNDWIKIECKDICSYSCGSDLGYNGWVKWREGDELLIRLLYAC